MRGIARVLATVVLLGILAVVFSLAGHLAGAETGVARARAAAPPPATSYPSLGSGEPTHLAWDGVPIEVSSAIGGACGKHDLIATKALACPSSACQVVSEDPIEGTGIWKEPGPTGEEILHVGLGGCAGGMSVSTVFTSPLAAVGIPGRLATPQSGDGRGGFELSFGGRVLRSHPVGDPNTALGDAERLSIKEGWTVAARSDDPPGVVLRRGESIRLLVLSPDSSQLIDFNLEG